jgi:hypothetical protein
MILLQDTVARATENTDGTRVMAPFTSADKTLEVTSNTHRLVECRDIIQRNGLQHRALQECGELQGFALWLPG